jgi:16S rRNA (guanine527-N7)-methyltransferase
VIVDGEEASEELEPIRRVLLQARALGLLGPGPIEPHIDHARGFSLTLSQGLASDRATSSVVGPRRVVDLGSGGGLPGLVLAREWPESEFVLLEAGERRAEFLRWAVFECELGDRVSVLHERAEIAGRDSDLRASFDAAVARSFGPPAVVAECAAPLLSVGGHLIVSEPPGGQESERWPAAALSALGLSPARTVQLGYSYQVLRQLELCAERFPRRNGVPSKRPLF